MKNIFTVQNYDERVAGMVAFLSAGTIENGYPYPLPASVYPLFYLYGKASQEVIYPSEIDQLVGNVKAECERAEKLGKLREYVEMACTLKPELADTLWKMDQVKPISGNRNYIRVTTYNSYYAPEITRYLAQSGGYVSDKRKLILIPCAEKKPYEVHNIFHREIRDYFRDSYEVAVVSGTLGIVPLFFWPTAPKYDAGIPNFYRVEESLRSFFSRNNHFDKIISVVDFYGKNVLRVLASYNDKCQLHFPLPVGWSDSYTDLVTLLPYIKQLK